MDAPPPPPKKFSKIPKKCYIKKHMVRKNITQNMIFYYELS